MKARLAPALAALTLTVALATGCTPSTTKDDACTAAAAAFEEFAGTSPEAPVTEWVEAIEEFSGALDAINASGELDDRLTAVSETVHSLVDAVEDLDASGESADVGAEMENLTTAMMELSEFCVADE